MYKVVYSSSDVKLSAKFDTLGSLCCFLVAYEPCSFVVYDSRRRVIASTKSMKCVSAFHEWYKRWQDALSPCSFRPYVFDVK